MSNDDVPARALLSEDRYWELADGVRAFRAEETRSFVHNHGTEDGPGLGCHELLVDGQLKGACLRGEQTASPSE